MKHGYNRLGVKLSDETKRKIGDSHRKEKHYNWKGYSNLKYRTAHVRMAQLYGKASHCENKKCPKISRWYEWALKKGKTYEPIRSNYKMLCRKCHSVYDEQLKKAWITRKLIKK